MHIFDPSSRGRYHIPLITGVALCSAFIMFVAWAERPGWSGWAPSLFILCQDMAALSGGVVASTIFAWVGVSDSAAFERELVQLGNRTNWDRIRLHVALALFLATTTATIPFLLLLFIDINQRSSSPLLGMNPEISTAWFLGTVAFIVTSSLSGILIGRALGSNFAILLAAVVSYLVVWLPVSSVEQWFFSSIAPLTGEVWSDTTPALGIAIARAFTWIFLLFCEVSLLLKASRFLAIAVLGVSFSISSILLLGPGSRQIIPESSQIVCKSTGSLEICTRAPLRTGLTAFTTIGSRVHTAFPSDMRPTRIVTESSNDGFFIPRGTLFLATASENFSGSSLPSSEQTVMATFSNLTVARCENENGYLGTLTAYGFLLERAKVAHATAAQPWETDGNAFTQLSESDRLQVEAGIEALMKMPRTESDHWLRSHWNEINSCTLSASNIPHA